MRRIVGEDLQDLGGFAGLVFVTEGIRLKQSVEAISDDGTNGGVQWERALPDLDWDLVNPCRTYVDIGFEFYPQTGEALTGAWSYDTGKHIGHVDILERFLGSNLNKSWYRLDQFSLIRSLGGFSYNIPIPSGGCVLDRYEKQ